MASLTLSSPWPMQQVADVLYELWEQQTGQKIKVTVTPKSAGAVYHTQHPEEYRKLPATV